MLITEEVEIKLGRNYKYYEEKGYFIPKEKTQYYLNNHKNGTTTTVKHGTKIKVKVSDLTKGSKVIVECVCDNCEKKLSMMYSTYFKTNHDGKIYCRKCAKHIFNSKENNHRYNKNKTDEERINGRLYLDYINFIRNVLKRDKYTCYCCKKSSKESIKLNVHHINSYDWCIEERTDIRNGICLCENCHKNFHSIYGYGNNTKEQFLKWLNISEMILPNYNYTLSPTKIAYCIEDEEIIPSIKEYCKNNFNGKGIPNIYNCCNHKRVKDGKYEYNILSYRKKHYIWYEEYLNSLNM